MMGSISEITRDREPEVGRQFSQGHHDPSDFRRLERKTESHLEGAKEQPRTLFFPFPAPLVKCKKLSSVLKITQRLDYN